MAVGFGGQASPSHSSTSVLKRRTTKALSKHSMTGQSAKSISPGGARESISAAAVAPKIYPRWHNIVAGAAAGAGARLLTAPLDLLKIRRQLQQPSTIATAAAAQSPKFTPFGMITSLHKIVQTEGGFKSLFRGNLAATYLWIGYAAVQFSLYARASDFLISFQMNEMGNVSPPLHLPPPLEPFQKPAQFASDIFSTIGSNPTAVAFCSGAAAGTAATLATYPFDICRTAFASQKTLSQGTKSISAFFQQAMKNNPQPIRTLFAGSMPATVGIIPYMGLNFALYDYLIKRGNKVKVKDAGAAGAIAGGTSKLIVYPFDTVKKRLQAQAFDSFWGNASDKVGKVPYKNMFDCATRVTKEEGISAFYRGLVPTVIKTMTATSLTFAVFTFAKNSLESVHDWANGEGKAIIFDEAS